MYGGIDVFLDQLFAYQYGVLVVIALPGHKAYEDIASQRYLSLIGGGAVRYHLPGYYPFALYHYGTLVDAGALVGAFKLDYVVGSVVAVIAGYHYMACVNALYDAVLAGKHHDA